MEILRDTETRDKAGIIVKAYDAEVTDYVETRYADQVLLATFADEAIRGKTKGHQVIMTFTRPENWKTDVVTNSLDNAIRY